MFNQISCSFRKWGGSPCIGALHTKEESHGLTLAIHVHVLMYFEMKTDGGYLPHGAHKTLVACGATVF